MKTRLKACLIRIVFIKTTGSCWRRRLIFKNPFDELMRWLESKAEDATHGFVWETPCHRAPPRTSGASENGLSRLQKAS